MSKNTYLHSDSGYSPQFVVSFEHLLVLLHVILL
jgi:hypothetical protein